MARAGLEQATGPACRSLLVTLATPHAQPPLPLLPSMAHFYAQLKPATAAAGVVSISSGSHDVQVRNLRIAGSIQSSSSCWWQHAHEQGHRGSCQPLCALASTSLPVTDSNENPVSDP